LFDPTGIQVLEAEMVPVRDLFESHLLVGDLARSMAFFGEVVGLELAHVVPDRRVAFYWIGERGQAMLGLWEVGTAPQRMSLHLAFRIDLDDLLRAAALLQAAGVTPRDFSGNPTEEPVVLAWMPAASLYFHDPDGNLLEFLSMLPDSPEPELGVVGWNRWIHRHDLEQSHAVDQAFD
jgi:lactoylglutathione lyase